MNSAITKGIVNVYIIFAKQYPSGKVFKRNQLSSRTLGVCALEFNSSIYRPTFPDVSGLPSQRSIRTIDQPRFDTIRLRARHVVVPFFLPGFTDLAVTLKSIRVPETSSSVSIIMGHAHVSIYRDGLSCRVSAAYSTAVIPDVD